jgi:hypothetical protein
MNLPELREESRPKMITNMIQEFAEKGDCFLWQDFTKNRMQIAVDFISINGSGIIFETSENPNYKFNPALVIYFYEDTKECIFKTKIITMKGNKIVLAIPELILTLDNRLFTRTIPEKETLVSFSLNSSVKGELNFSKNVLDFSKQGLALKIIGREYLHFYEGDKIDFNIDQCDISLPSKVGTIMYAIKNEEKKLSKELSYRVGVCFK